MGKQKVLKTCLVGALVCSLGIGLATTAHAQSVDTEYDLIELNRDKNQNLIIDSSFENGRQHWKTTGQGTFTDYPECAATGLWCGLLPCLLYTSRCVRDRSLYRSIEYEYEY